MSKIINWLSKQESTEFKKDALECLEVYNKLKEINNGSVWSSEWNILVLTIFEGFLSNQRRFELTKIGKIFLNGIKNK